MYGVLLSAVTEEALLDIYRTYLRVCGGRGAESWVDIFSKSPADIECRHETLNELLGEGHWFEDRLGSSLMVIDCHRGDKPVEDRDAKLFCKSVRVIYYGGNIRDNLVHFYFDPNIAEGKKAEAMTRAFEKAVDSFLIEKNLAIELD